MSIFENYSFGFLCGNRAGVGQGLVVSGSVVNILLRLLYVLLRNCGSWRVTSYILNPLDLLLVILIRSSVITMTAPLLILKCFLLVPSCIWRYFGPF